MKSTILINNYLENSAIRYPNKIAVIHGDRRVTYNQLNTQANSLASNLISQGIGKGDRVALLLRNSVDYIIAYYAILKAGAVATPINPGLRPEGLQYLINDMKPASIITNSKSERLLKAIDLSHPSLKCLIIRSPKQKWAGVSFGVHTFGQAIAKALPQSAEGVVSARAEEGMANIASQDDLASIIYTSGSTGEPKGVMLSHKNIVSNTDSICEYLKLTQSDIQMVILPFYYVMGKSLLNTHVAVGGTVVINNRFMYPADVVHQMITENVTGFSGVPSTYAYLLNRSPLAKSRDQLVDLRYCSQAGGHMSAALKTELRDALPKETEIFIMYGATEASARLSYLDSKYFKKKMGSIGKPISNVTIRIMDENHKEVEDGDEGELVASGPNIMMGYWKDPQNTAVALDSAGYHTGDIGYRDREGFLYVLRRKDGLLKVGGHRINPMEIEDFLMDTNLLIEVAVVGVPDELLGNSMVALVVPRAEHCTDKYVLKKCTEGLPKHKIPSDVLLMKALPKNANTKIDQLKCVEIALKRSNRLQQQA